MADKKMYGVFVYSSEEWGIVPWDDDKTPGVFNSLRDDAGPFNFQQARTYLVTKLKDVSRDYSSAAKRARNIKKSDI